MTAVAAKGVPVKAFDTRPELPDYLLLFQKCLTDNVHEGRVGFADCMVWAELYGVEDTEELWEVVTRANYRVQKWQQAQSTQQQTGKAGGSPSTSKRAP